MRLPRGREEFAARVRRAAGAVTALFPPRADSEMRALAAELTRALRGRLQPPVDVRELARALCAEMSRRRDGRPVELRFERFPDEIEVTGLWLQFQDFDLVIVEERAETVQQLVILGHELWHLKEGHHDHHVVGAAAAARALSGEPGRIVSPGTPGGPDGPASPGCSDEPASPGRPGGPASPGTVGTPRVRAVPGSPGWPGIALTVAARNGSHETEEAAAEEFGLHLASAFRSWVTRPGPQGPAAGSPIQASLGYRDPRTERR
ncbi:toxin-antitoxin system, toxin component [Streptomyces sp. NPDC005907]|uniref:toxin-antitoxin system, toxin component n=1 Tax=Streptomyces sp. NPDC005907 TaxID=3154571 RepID=UPI0033E11E58